MRNNSVVIDTTHGIKQIPHLIMQVRTASNEPNSKSQPVLTDDALKIPPGKSKTITNFGDHPSEWNTRGTVILLWKFMETVNFPFSHSVTTIFDKKVADMVTNTKEMPYSIKKNTQIDVFSGVTPEQSKYIKPYVMAILSMIAKGDLDLTTYLNELLRTN